MKKSVAEARKESQGIDQISVHLFKGGQIPNGLRIVGKGELPPHGEFGADIDHKLGHREESEPDVVIETQLLLQCLGTEDCGLELVQMIQMGPKICQSLLEEGFRADLKESLGSLSGIQLHISRSELNVPNEGMIGLGIGAEDPRPTRNDPLPQHGRGVIQHNQVHMFVSEGMNQVGGQAQTELGTSFPVRVVGRIQEDSDIQITVAGGSDISSIRIEIEGQDALRCSLLKEGEESPLRIARHTVS
jgi:hypothetical protein